MSKAKTLSLSLQQKVSSWQQSTELPFLTQIKRGIEKENLRVTPDGKISQTPHPQSFGSALTHPYLTTDYSESLLEIIVPPFTTMKDLCQFFERIHQYAYAHMGEETLWAGSMPCELQGDKSIPIAEYGTSNLGKMKHIYRRGLDYRYGRTMQSIAGIHYNVSFSLSFWQQEQEKEKNRESLQDFISQKYFHIIRNFQRYAWPMIYLFGASPAMDTSFLPTKKHPLLQSLGDKTLYAPYATSLRLSDLGYHNRPKTGLQVSYNNLNEYVDNLNRAISTPFHEFEKMGLKKDGEYIQLNTHILQIENEFYGPIRPKRSLLEGERTAMALQSRGVEYIEVRTLDLNPLLPLGMNEKHIQWLDCFLLYCLWKESPPLHAEEMKELQHNQSLMAIEGRKPHLLLQREGKEVSAREWAREIFAEMQPVAELLDEAAKADPARLFCCGDQMSYVQNLQEQNQKIDQVELTPSHQILEMLKESGESFLQMTLRLSQEHKKSFLQTPLPTIEDQRLQDLAKKSLHEQKKKELNDRISFEDFLKEYFSNTY